MKIDEYMQKRKQVESDQFQKLRELEDAERRAKEIKDSLNQVLHEVRSKSIDNMGAPGSSLSSAGSSMRSMEQDLGFSGKERVGEGRGSSFDLGGDLPPLPGSRDRLEPKKKFKLF